MRATTRCGWKLIVQSLGDILRPTKGGDSYSQIAIKANEWLRQQREAGRFVGLDKMSSEQVRKIFCDEVTRPGRAYLQALAAVQGVSLAALYQAAGYPPPEPSSDPIERARFAFEGIDHMTDWQKEAIKKMIEAIPTASEQAKSEDRESHR